MAAASHPTSVVVSSSIAGESSSTVVSYVDSSIASSVPGVISTGGRVDDELAQVRDTFITGSELKLERRAATCKGWTQGPADSARGTGDEVQQRAAGGSTPSNSPGLVDSDPELGI